MVKAKGYITGKLILLPGGISVMEKTKVKVIVDFLRNYADNESGEKPIVIAPPCLGEPNKLRVYAYGGEIGRIAGPHPNAKCSLLSEAYFKYIKDQEEKDKLVRLINANSTERLLMMSDYIKLATKAAKIRYKGKERSVETEILKKFMKRGKRDWCVVDMEFFPSKQLFPSEQHKIRNGKPDLVVYDYKKNQFGVVELKYNNQSVDNIGKHLKDFKFISDNSKKFNNEMIRRVSWLEEFGLIENITDGFNLNNHVWYGFLFVGEDPEKSKKIAKSLQKKKDYEKAHFRYVQSVDALEKCGLSYDSMETFEQFTKNVK